MDVTDEILLNHQIYGPSDNTNPSGLSASRSLNYANGPTFQRPILEKATVVPYVIKFQGEVGLFGTENTFYKVDLNIKDTAIPGIIEEGFYFPAQITPLNVDTINDYLEAFIDPSKDPDTVNTYEPPIISRRLPSYPNPMVKIRLVNFGTNNIYNDNHVDVRLYTNERFEHPYELMFIGPKDHFYIGFHARNTRRLTVNVECIIGETYIDKSDISSTQYIAIKHLQ